MSNNLKSEKNAFNSNVRNAAPKLPRWMRRQLARDAKRIKKAMNSNHLPEEKYEPMECVLCGDTMKTVHDTHNPYPLTESTTGMTRNGKQEKVRCCTKCNHEKVIPARISMTSKSQLKVNDIRKSESQVTNDPRIITVTISEFIALMERTNVAMGE
jgi:hypothetical protein